MVNGQLPPENLILNSVGTLLLRPINRLPELSLVTLGILTLAIIGGSDLGSPRGNARTA